MPIKLVVLGAAGRMGRTLVRAIAEDPRMRLHAAIDRAGSTRLGEDGGVLSGIGPVGVALTHDLSAAIEAADAIVDFTTPALSVAVAVLSAPRGLVHVIGTTGLSADETAQIEAAAASGARIVRSGNMSLGVNLLAALVEQAAKALGPDAFDIEILEMHHRHKVDAPSGTALLLGRAAAEGRGVDLSAASVRVRDGQTGARPAGAIGFASLRGGSVVGEHQVILAGEGERIELSHRAEDRSIFARGALRAAVWALDRPPGIYSMRDVLGLS